MVVIHRIFRRELPMVADLARRFPDGPSGRLRAVGRHAQLVLAELHYHHEAEDEHLWPLLLDAVCSASR